MTAVQLAFFSALDIALYTARSYTGKRFADACPGAPEAGTYVFSAVTGLVGWAATVLCAGGLRAALSPVTLLCGVAAGASLLLYNLGCIRAATTGPFAVQSVLGMFGSVLPPLLFDAAVRGLRLSALQYMGVTAVLCACVLLHPGSRGANARIQRGYWGWVALMFCANGVYSILMEAQQRLTGGAQRAEMVASVFLSMAVLSLVCLIAAQGARWRRAFCLPRRAWGYALASAGTLTAAMHLLVVLLGFIPAAVLYPVQNSAILVLLVLLSAVRLHERLTRRALTGVAAALAGIAALSLQP